MAPHSSLESPGHAGKKVGLSGRQASLSSSQVARGRKEGEVLIPACLLPPPRRGSRKSRGSEKGGDPAEHWHLSHPVRGTQGWGIQLRRHDDWLPATQPKTSHLQLLFPPQGGDPSLEEGVFLLLPVSAANPMGGLGGHPQGPVSHHCPAVPPPKSLSTMSAGCHTCSWPTLPSASSSSWSSSTPAWALRAFS